jgi:hypothetical protein
MRHLVRFALLACALMVISLPVCAQSPSDLSRCFLRRSNTGKLILWVDADPAQPFVVYDSIILINGHACTRYLYPERYRTRDGLTTRIGCAGNVAGNLPAIVTALNVRTLTPSTSSLQIDRPKAPNRAPGPRPN